MSKSSKGKVAMALLGAFLRMYLSQKINPRLKPGSGLSMRYKRTPLSKAVQNAKMQAAEAKRQRRRERNIRNWNKSQANQKCI